MAGRKVYGIVHGDIKPENIRLQEGDRVRVLDFGIAKHLSQTRRFTVNLFGSLPYTPPERLDRGGRRPPLRPLGAGRRPLSDGGPATRRSNGDDPEAVEGKIRSGKPPAPLPPDVSPALSRIIERSLAFDVARRYATAAEMGADLAAWSEGKPLPSEALRPEALDARDGRDDLNATRRTRMPLDDSGSFRSPETRRTVTPRRNDRLAGCDPSAVSLSATSELCRAARHAGDSRLRAATGAAAGEAAALAGAAHRHPARRHGRPRPPRCGCAAKRAASATTWRPRPRPTSTACGRAITASRRSACPARASRTCARTSRSRWSSRRTASSRPIAAIRPRPPSPAGKGRTNRLKEAVDVDYSDRSARAKMLYAQGHLDRIDSQSLRAQGKRKEAQDKLQDAVYEFEEAAKLAPDWPDPYLGLARVYSYEQSNLPKLEETLNQLAQHNYPWGRREKAMLADAHRIQAQQLQAQALAAQGTEKERELLENAKDHYNQPPISTVRSPPSEKRRPIAPPSNAAGDDRRTIVGHGAAVTGSTAMPDSCELAARSSCRCRRGPHHPNPLLQPPPRPPGEEGVVGFEKEDSSLLGLPAPLSPGRRGGGWERGGWGSEGFGAAVAAPKTRSPGVA